MISNENIFVNRDLCYACGICVERCILDNLRLHLAPCRTACPIHMNCQGYVRLIAQEKEKEAAEEMRRYLPFSRILGRVCHHPCESACERTRIGDGPVHIRALKRYLADKFSAIARSLPIIKDESRKKVAIVGSGPSGLMAAYELRSFGHTVTVFEAQSAPGGLLHFGIPSFILPVKEVDTSIRMLEEMGVRFETGKTLGSDFYPEDLVENYDAVLLAIGLNAQKSLEIPGKDIDGVFQGLDLIGRVKENNEPSLGKSVIVIGGGNSAVSSALTCISLGAQDVKIICLEDRDKMPAFEYEIQMALEEGVTLENAWGPRRITRGDHGKLHLDVSRCLRMFNEKGGFSPVFEQDNSQVHKADSIVIAIGQDLNRDFIQPDLISEDNHLIADPLTLQSLSHEKIFCAGDAVTGPSSVVDAMAQGKRAAVSIDRKLSGDTLKWGRDFWAENGYLKLYEADYSRACGGDRRVIKRFGIRGLNKDTEIQRTLTHGEAKEEAERCISCGRPSEFNKTCWYCLPCEIECPTNALEVRLPYLIR